MFFMRFPIDAVFVGKAGSDWLAARAVRAPGRPPVGRAGAARPRRRRRPGAARRRHRRQRDRPGRLRPARLRPRRGGAGSTSPLVIGARRLAVAVADRPGGDRGVARRDHRRDGVAHFNDEYAYWLAGARLAAGEPLYDLAAAPNTPFAYWYPPPLAQVLAPLTSFVGRRRVQRRLDGPAARLPVVARRARRAGCAGAGRVPARRGRAARAERAPPPRRARRAGTPAVVGVLGARGRAQDHAGPRGRVPRRGGPVARRREGGRARASWCSASASRWPRRRGGSSSTSWACGPGPTAARSCRSRSRSGSPPGAVLAVVAGLVAAGRLGAGRFPRLAGRGAARRRPDHRQPDPLDDRVQPARRDRPAVADRATKRRASVSAEQAPAN